ncbi:MAG: histidine phosphatase family protein [Candidatus Pacebacteria bacterium]|nr:histidine phosphatase family protein [Candidatus Paceibacterota bacterium]MBP9843021.1 histidine phosphatase family protein [Candidatus Paceibacterota bacterium]
MKWPSHLVIIRHGESAYNALRAEKARSELYQEFLASFKADYRSSNTVELAHEVRRQFALEYSDYATPLSERGRKQALVTGCSLIETHIPKPDVVFVSPYLRTNQTFQGLLDGGWDVAGARVVQEDRIREQEHGLSLLYSDWRVFHALHPEQAELHSQLGPYWYQYPQGESVSMVRDRVRSFMNTLVREHSGQVVCLVSHHLTKLSIRSLLERWPPEEFIRVDIHEKPVNCGITHYMGDPDSGLGGKLVLKEYNLKLW